MVQEKFIKIGSKYLETSRLGASNGGEALVLRDHAEAGFLEELESAIRNTYPKPKMLVLNFPSNPTGHCVELPFFERVVEIAKQHDLWVVHDLAYADLVFDGYQAPGILQVPGARDIAVEFFTLSKSYNMPGWRVGFCCGNPELIAALTRIKSYLDYVINALS